MSLATKLAEVMGAIHRIPKSGKNTFHNYDYVTEADLVEAIRGELAKRHIVLVPNCTKHDMKDMPPTAKGKAQFLTLLSVEFTFIDGESDERITFSVPGSGIDGEDKGAYKALTGAEKYALMKFFLVPTGDDPERDDRKRDKEQEFLKCEECGRNITAFTKPDSGEKVPMSKVMDNGRKRWNLDLCGGCQIGRARKEKEAQAAPPAESKPAAGEVALIDPEIVEMGNDEVAAIGTITWSKLADGKKPFTFRMGEKMFSCWSATIASELLKAEKTKKKVEIICVTKKGFTNVEKLIRVGDVPYEELTAQKDEVPF